MVLRYITLNQRYMAQGVLPRISGWADFALSEGPLERCPRWNAFCKMPADVFNTKGFLPEA